MAGPRTDRRDSFAVTSVLRLMSENLDEHFMLYKKEFYLLWYTGIRDDFVPKETVVVCTIAIDDGSTTVIRVFHSNADDEHRAEDKLLEWFDNDPYINISNHLNIDIIMNLPPHGAFSKAFVHLTQLFADQEKEIKIHIKIVKIHNSDIYGMESIEIREGLIDLHEAGVQLSPVTGEDWTYLREVLRENTGLSAQERNYMRTQHQLESILGVPDSSGIINSGPEDSEQDANAERS